MKYSVSLLAILTVAALLWSPSDVSAQNKDIVALQRDIADLTRKFEALRTNQGERLDAIEGLIKQATETSRSLSMELHGLQVNLQQSMQKSVTEQQRGVAEPMAAVRSGVDNVGQDVLALKTEVSSLTRGMSKLEGMMTELQAAIRILNAPPAAPPPSASDAANQLFTSAERDFLSGSNELASEELKQFWQLYPSSPNAPRALLLLGQVYDRVGQYKDARDAFDVILERFPDSTTTPEAAYWKAEVLAKEGNRAGAATEFDNFAKKYPSHLNAAQAKARAAELRRGKGNK